MFFGRFERRFEKRVALGFVWTVEATKFGNALKPSSSVNV